MAPNLSDPSDADSIRFPAKAPKLRELAERIGPRNPLQLLTPTANLEILQQYGGAFVIIDLVTQSTVGQSYDAKRALKLALELAL